MGKRILKVSLISLLSLISFIFFALTVLSFSAPLYMASRFEDMGFSSLAYGCYDREYKTTTKVDEQYTMFNKAVDIGFDAHVVYYGNRLINNEKYEILWTKISMDNMQKVEKYILENPGLSNNAKKRLRITAFNEDNYIKNKYVESLIKTDKAYVAKDFVFGEMYKIMDSKSFGKYTSVCIGTYAKEYGGLSLEEVKVIEDFFKAYLENCDPEPLNPTTEDLVVLQRLFETANAISISYEKLGDAQNTSKWLNIAEGYRTAIYGE